MFIHRLTYTHSLVQINVHIYPHNKISLCKEKTAYRTGNGIKKTFEYVEYESNNMWMEKKSWVGVQKDEIKIKKMRITVLDDYMVLDKKKKKMRIDNPIIF